MKDELFDELIESVRQGGAILRGEAQPSRSFEITVLDVKHICESYGLSQPEFETLRNSEQGCHAPEVMPE